MRSRVTTRGNERPPPLLRPHQPIHRGAVVGAGTFRLDPALALQTLLGARVDQMRADAPAGLVGTPDRGLEAGVEQHVQGGELGWGHGRMKPSRLTGRRAIGHG